MTNEEIEALDNNQKAQIESLISSTINVTNSIKGTAFSKFDEDVRVRIRKLIYDMIDEVHNDDSDWANVSHNMYYDVYLEMREEEELATDYDRHRPGLIASQFSSDVKFKEHLDRIVEYKNSHGGKPKMCTSCGNVKSATKFKRGGGSVCNACRCKNYRKNRKEEIKALKMEQGG
jgi:hypothetical protein